jgi:hypothetical protein
MSRPDESPRSANRPDPRTLPLLEGAATLLAAIVMVALRGPKLPPSSGG